MEIFYVLTKYDQSRLLQNCRMRERVNYQCYRVSKGIQTVPILLADVISNMEHDDGGNRHDYGNLLCIPIKLFSLKTLLQREKFLNMSYFSFHHNVFRSRLLQMREHIPSCGNVLICCWLLFR